jgi:S-DNA-T family DNA segregation ATPase FtsK/SpoIIIE
MVALLCAAAFYTYDASSTPGHLANVVGPVGFFLADTLVKGFGIGAFALCFYLLLMGYLVATGCPIRNQAIRMVGLLVCMLVLGSLMHAMLGSRSFPGGSAPLGGVVGESLAWKMTSVLGKPLSLVTLLMGGLAGVVLASDDLLSGVLRSGTTSRKKTAASNSWLATMLKPKGKSKTAAVAAQAKADEEVAAPRPKRAAAKNAKSSELSEEDEEWDEEEDEDWEDEDEGEEYEDDEDEEEELDEDEEEDYEDEEELEEEEVDVAPAAKRVRISQGARPVDADGIEVIRLTKEKELADKYELPSLALLAEPTYLKERESDAALQQKASALMNGLTDFGVSASVDEVERGPVITRFDLNLARGTKISKVTGLADDLAMAMGVRRVRIAPVKGKSALGVEIPNKFRETVFLKELAVAQDVSKSKIAIPLFLGKDASGNPIVEDLATTPHLLIAGRTGAGKSVFVNNLILSILMTRYPEEVRLIMIDPKKVELEVYQDIPHLLTKVESNPKKATKILEWAVNQMEERYEVLAATGVRHVTSYNRLGKKARREKLGRVYSDEEVDRIPEQMPFIVIIVDELADLMMVAGKEVEQSIARLAQKARAVGIHVVLATQRPSTDVITGLIKSNLPARIAFQTRTGIDSRTILDRYGAEKLLDKGDMLYLSSTSDDPRRIQGPFVSDDEVERVVAYLKEHAAPLYTHHMEQVGTEQGDAQSVMNQDELFSQAVDVVFTTGQASASFLQRRMKVGYARASRLIDLMGDAGIVSEHKGSKAREILMTPEQWEEIKSGVVQGAQQADS